MKREQSIVRLKQRLTSALASPKAIHTSPPRQPSPTTVSEIIDGKVYIGANSASYSKAGLTRLNIKHVIRVGQLPRVKHAGIDYMLIEVPKAKKPTQPAQDNANLAA